MRDMDFSKPKGKARDAPLPERLSTKSRDFNLREAKAGSVSADDLIRKRQQEKTGAQETEAPEEPSLNADTAVLREREPQPETEGRHTLRQHGNKYQQRFQEEAKAEDTPAAAPEEPKKPSKLTFDADELPLQDQPDRKLTRARSKAERTAEKLEKAEKRLPSYRKLRMETTSAPETGKKKTRLKFEQEVKSQSAHVKGPAVLRPVKGAAGMAAVHLHRKVYQAEHENVGIKAAHRTEIVGEAGVRTAYRLHKTSPYRKVARLQKKAAGAEAKAAYAKLLHDHPELKKKTLAKLWYKKS